MHKYLFFLLFFFLSGALKAQVDVSGSVVDNSKKNYVEGARVISTGGQIAYTDSFGHYHIAVLKSDSIFFVYNGKPTQKFAVADIANPSQFDISVLVPVKSRYSTLTEAIVFTKSHRQDSIENRDNYANVFDYHKPRVETSISPGGGVGMDLDELINMFRFRRNRSLKAFQKRLETQEQDKYVDYRFSKKNVSRITHLTGQALDSFVVWYRPSYEFTSNSTEIVFNQYVLNAYYQFQKVTGIGELKKEDD